MIWDVTIAYFMVATVMFYLHLRTLQEYPMFIEQFGMRGALTGALQAAFFWPVFMIQVIILAIRRL